MNETLANDVINAVLYEGYILYPYRPSSRKNARERFTFGRVYPQSYSIAQHGIEPCAMRTECIAEISGASPVLDVKVRFLHPMARNIGLPCEPLPEWRKGTEPRFKVVPELRVDGELFQTWQEAVEREIHLPLTPLGHYLHSEVAFRFPGVRTLEPIHGREGEIVGLLERVQKTIEGSVDLFVEYSADSIRKIRVRILNRTQMPMHQFADSDAVLMRTMASTHTILRAQDAGFISLLEPPDELQDAAADCRNIGTWPVLLGEAERRERDAMLSSPIILYDYPKVAAESAGPLFDGTEIDEILTLRILTMTDQEKLEMRAVDEQARRLLERTEALPAESLMKLHGVMRGAAPGKLEPGNEADAQVGKPALRNGGLIEFDDFFGANLRLTSAFVDGVRVQPGDRVRLRPKARADILDLALAGKTAVVEAVEQDAEKRIHLAVVLDDDPGKDLGLMRQPGHRFFYGVDEVEPLLEEAT